MDGPQKIEVWKNHWSGLQVSNRGRVKCRSGSLIPLKQNALYKQVRVKELNIGFRVHLLVWDLFGDKTRVPKSRVIQVNHKDCDKWNNDIDNLELVTGKMNMRHAVENGRLKGRRRGICSKLTHDDVLLIRFIGHQIRPTDLARIFGVSLTSVWNVVNYKSFSHI